MMKRMTARMIPPLVRLNAQGGFILAMVGFFLGLIFSGKCSIRGRIFERENTAFGFSVG